LRRPYIDAKLRKQVDELLQDIERKAAVR